MGNCIRRVGTYPKSDVVYGQELADTLDMNVQTYSKG